MRNVREEISDLVDEAYKDCKIKIDPLYPKVLIRVLPKAHTTGSGLYLPDSHNKPLLEGVVLETYKPFFRTFRVTQKKEDGVAVSIHEEILVSPRVKVGDHVVMQHFHGAPVPPLDGGTGEYRVVAEEHFIVRLNYERNGQSERSLTTSGV